jgi:DNA-binding protein YbaB
MPDGTETQPVVTTPPAGSPGTGNDGNWEARFKGLQALLAQKESAWATKEASLQATVTQLTQEAHGYHEQLNTVQGTVQATQEQLQAVTKERDEKTALAATAQTGNERLKTILKYPSLLPYEESGALRTDLTGAAFEEHLKTVMRLNGIAGPAPVTGAIPPGKGNARQGVPNLDALIEQMRPLYSQPEKQNELHELQKQYAAALRGSK